MLFLSHLFPTIIIGNYTISVNCLCQRITSISEPGAVISKTSTIAFRF
jgi:hypothetical protein